MLDFVLEQLGPVLTRLLLGCLLFPACDLQAGSGKAAGLSTLRGMWMEKAGSMDPILASCATRLARAQRTGALLMLSGAGGGCAAGIKPRVSSSQMKDRLQATNQHPSQMFQREPCKLLNLPPSVRCWVESALGTRWRSQWDGTPQVMVAALSRRLVTRRMVCLTPCISWAYMFQP